MALDGTAISGIVHELRQTLLGGRIDKITQPEFDEIIIPIRSRGSNHKLLMTASPSHPRLHLTNQPRSNPLQAPAFCMVLRKHLTGGKIIDIIQPSFERIVELHAESLDEMGDISRKKLIIEIMGKHSNIILVGENGLILDAAKRITHEKSSVREVMPGREYFVPATRKNPITPDRSDFLQTVESKNGQKLQNILYQSYNGISPIMASEICARADCDPSAADTTRDDTERLYESFTTLMSQINEHAYQYKILYDEKNKVHDFCFIDMILMKGYRAEPFQSPSEMLDFFYQEKDKTYRMGQKTADLRKLVNLHIDRCLKKKEVYRQTGVEIEDRNIRKLYGELITANIYAIRKGMTTFIARNFYEENNEIEIPLDSDLTPAENAQKYFRRYNKEKRTFAALQDQIKQNDEELVYLDGILTAIQSTSDESDIEEIRDELREQGFIKSKKKNSSQKQKKSKPLHFVSSEGFDIYVGKNNKQNDELTLRFAAAGDIWLHTKEIPGSHVIIRCEGRVPGQDTITEGAVLAAYYSKARNSSHVPVDYTQKKNVKKPSGAKPGMVIYESYKTAMITPDEVLIGKLIH